MSEHETTARPRPATAIPAHRDKSNGRAAFDPGAAGPPHDPGVEMALLGSLLIDPKCIGPVCMIVDEPEAFFARQNQIIFAAILELFQADTGIDGLTLLHRLQQKNVMEAAGGHDYIRDLLGSVPSAANAETYARIVRDKALLRRLISACAASMQECYQSADAAGDVLDRAEKRIFDIAQRKITGQAVELTDILNETFEMLDRNSGEHLSGLATGFIELDNLTSGLQKGEMIVIAARPSVGKTALAMNIVEHVGVNLKKTVGVFSLEMSRQQLAQRMLCARSGVDSHHLRRGMLSRQDRDRLGDAVGELSQGRIFIDDTPAMTLLDLRTKARRLQMQHGIELVVIDYLQLMEAPREENRQQQISSISRGIKALAREIECPVICLSQLNRAPESENRLPRTSDLRESGSIEQDADVVMLLHREAVMHRGDKDWEQNNPDKLNEALLIVAKQRNGPCDTIHLTFLANSTRFATCNPGYGAPV
jgi:replicative DNA helicase